MKRIALAVLLCLWPAAAWATCASPISGKDGTGATITLGAVVDGSSNCWSGMAIGDGAAMARFASVTAAGTGGTNGLAIQGLAGGVAMPVSGTFWQTTQPVSIAALPALVAGSATIGKVDLLGNAGAVMDFAGQNAASPANSLLIGGQFNTTPTTITSGNASPFQLDSAGNLLVNVKAGGGSGGTSSNFSATYPSTGTAAGAEYLSSAPTLTSGQMVALQVTSAGSLHATVDNSNANGQATMANSSPVAIASNQSAVPVSPTTYPATAVPITASATGTTSATTATLANVTGHTTYICGFSIRANAAAAATGNATMTGVITGTMNFTQWTAPNASGLGVTEEVFSPCIPASAVSTSIAVISAAPGTSGVVSVSAWGYSI